MDAPNLNLDGLAIAIASIDLTPGMATIAVAPTAEAACPLRGRHSGCRYRRTLADLPRHGRAVVLVLDWVPGRVVRSRLDRHRDWLNRRIDEGCIDSARLREELIGLGCRMSPAVVRRDVAKRLVAAGTARTNWPGSSAGIGLG